LFYRRESSNEETNFIGPRGPRDFKAGSTQDASINLNGVVDEWNTVTAEFTIVTVTDTDGTPVVVSSNKVLGLKNFTMTTDITGALGVDGPVGVTIKWGYVYHEAAEYHGVAGFKDINILGSTGSYLGTLLTFTIVDKVNLITLIAPGTYMSGDWTYNGDPGAALDSVFSVEAQFLGLVDGLDFNIWYGNDPNKALNQTGLTLGYSLDTINLGAAFKYDIDASVAGAGASFQYVMDILTTGLSFGVADFSVFDAAKIGLNITFHALEVLDVYAAAFMDFTGTFSADAGVDFFLGSVTYRLGYDYGGTGFHAPNGEGLYFKVSGAF